MTLISALLGIAADRLLPHLHEYRRYEPFLAYVDWVRERLSGPAWEHIGGLLLLLLPVWTAVVLVQSWTSDWLFGLVGLLFYVAVLVYCLGPRDLGADVDTYCQAHESGDSGLQQRANSYSMSAASPSIIIPFSLRARSANSSNTSCWSRCSCCSAGWDGSTRRCH